MAEVELAEPLPPDLQAKGPAQEGRGVHGQYVYWICMAMPRQETILARGIKRPTDFDRDSFRELIVQTYTEEGLVVIETACFLEPHADGEPHLPRLRGEYSAIACDQALCPCQQLPSGIGRKLILPSHA